MSAEKRTPLSLLYRVFPPSTSIHRSADTTIPSLSIVATFRGMKRSSRAPLLPMPRYRIVVRLCGSVRDRSAPYPYTVLDPITSIPSPTTIASTRALSTLAHSPISPVPQTAMVPFSYRA